VIAIKKIVACPKHNFEKSTFICALVSNTHIKVIHAFDKFYYFDSIKKHVFKHGYDTAGALSIPPVPGGRYQPQHDNVQVKFPLQGISSYNGRSHTGHFFLDMGALCRCLVSLKPGSFALSPLEDRAHRDPLNKTPRDQVYNFSFLRAHCQLLKRCALFKQDRQCTHNENCDAFVSPFLE
jgi:hypothetical protein